MRRDYRELLLTSQIGKYISGVILFKETLYQSTATGKPFVRCLQEQGVHPGIKVDEVGASPACPLLHAWATHGHVIGKDPRTAAHGVGPVCRHAVPCHQSTPCQARP